MMHNTRIIGDLDGAIDVHAHYVTASYRVALQQAGIARPDGFGALPDWTPGSAIEHMDRLGIAAALLSISSPGVFFGDRDAASALARTVNDEGAAVVAAGSGRFGLLASLPLPDVDRALDEIAYVHDELGADGVVLLTNYGGAYLGDDGHDELFAELDRRAAVVVLHPTSPPGWEISSLGRPRPMIEFPFDTTRTVFRLVLDGVFERYPNVRVVVPHVGGALPVLVDRVVGVTSAVRAPGDPAIDVLGSLARLHYDLAGDALPRALPALLAMVGPERLLYGSDHPFPPDAAVQRFGHALATTAVLSDEARRQMLRSNALDLFPRLAGDHA
jgi:predicted TIM-barrel fold metal-dependent hydrolase